MKNFLIAIGVVGLHLIGGFTATSLAHDSDQPNFKAEYKYVKTIDGDTFKVDTNFLPAELDKLSIRVNGIDTPEKGHRAECEEERILGDKATKFATEYLDNADEIIVINAKWGKYGGRVVADVIVDDVNYAEMMIEKGYAKAYDGGTKPKWCPEE